MKLDHSKRIEFSKSYWSILICIEIGSRGTGIVTNKGLTIYFH